MSCIRKVFPLLFWPLTAAAVAPNDYATGIELAEEPGKPLQEITLPDALYAGIQHADLSDLRVFNAEGVAVPHALCAAAPAASTPPTSVPLRVFPLQAARADETQGSTHIEVQTQGKVELSVQPAKNATPAAQTTVVAAYVIDAREAQQVLQALSVDWHSSDGASELQVRVEASEDLDHWTTLVARTALLHVGAGGQRLERVRIPLPPAKYRYLRLQRIDEGPQPELRGVSAEAVSAAVARPAEWFEATALPATQTEVRPQFFLFDAWHLAPLSTARLLLPASNMSLRVSLHSRVQENDNWRSVWSGEVFALDEAAGERRNADIAFSATTDRYWRLQVQQGTDSLNQQPLRLQLGYLPGRLRFLAQGEGPYVLAFGSARAPVATPQDCDGLLTGLGADDLGDLLGQAQAGTSRALGGTEALTPLPQQTPLRLILLWAVLILGSAMLVVMAWSLLKRVQTSP